LFDKAAAVGELGVDSTDLGKSTTLSIPSHTSLNTVRVWMSGLYPEPAGFLLHYAPMIYASRALMGRNRTKSRLGRSTDSELQVDRTAYLDDLRCEPLSLRLS
jgi:hypothetical protein